MEKEGGCSARLVMGGRWRWGGVVVGTRFLPSCWTKIWLLAEGGAHLLASPVGQGAAPAGK